MRPGRTLVTGAAGAFGSATVAALRDRGATVEGLDVRGGDGVLACDVTDQGQVEQAVGMAVERLSGLDAVVHYAGIGEPVDAGAPPGETARRTLDVNLLGPWRVTAAALPALLAARGRVVLVASELAYATLPFAAAYAVSKRGLAAYADALRLEYGSHLRVTTVYPGYVRTPIHEASLAAGLSMDGLVRREQVGDVVATVLRVLGARRPPRDTAATRAGAGELWLARHLPARVDAAIARRLRRELRRGRYQGVPLASGLVARLAPGGGPAPPTGAHQQPQRPARGPDGGPSGGAVPGAPPEANQAPGRAGEVSRA